MDKYNVFKGEDWLGSVLADSQEEAEAAANANADFNGWTTVEKRSSGGGGRSGAQ